MILFFIFQYSQTMHYSPKNKKRDNIRRIRQKSKNGVSPERKRHLKRRSSRMMRRNIRSEIKGQLKSAPSLQPSSPPPPPPPLRLSRQNAVCYDDPALVNWARNLPFQSILKHNLATDIQMAWRQKMLSKRIKARALEHRMQLLRRDINSVLETICELREFTNSPYVHLLDCSPLTTTLEFIYDRLYELSKLHYADMPAPSQRLGQYDEWYHLNGTIDRAHVLLEKTTARIIGVINTRSGSTPKNTALTKVVQNGRFGLRFADVKNMQANTTNGSRDCEEESWRTFIHAA